MDEYSEIHEYTTDPNPPRGKLFGQEIELDETLTQLQEAATSAVEETLSAPSVQDAAAGHPNDDPVAKILDEAARSPKAALLILASEIEREVREVIANLGPPPNFDVGSTSYVKGLAVLSQRALLPPAVLEALELFRGVRNRLVHGHHATADDVLRAIDSGALILGAVRGIPHWTKTVEHANLPLFEDSALTRRLPDVTGVVLRMMSPDRGEQNTLTLPTNRGDYRIGMRLSWEWSPLQVIREAWLVDPVTGDTRQAWKEAMVFVGRDLDSL